MRAASASVSGSGSTLNSAAKMSATGLIGLQRLPALAGREVSAHLAAIGDFVQRIQGNPARGGLCGAGKLAARKLDFGQPVQDQAQAAAPDFALDCRPIVEVGCIAERKSSEKITALAGGG